MRERPSARLLILDREGRILLFQFRWPEGSARAPFWATPGGALDPGETYEQAARRELFEETGLDLAEVGAEVHRREATIRLPDGEMAHADERFFRIDVDRLDLDTTGWTDLERQIMTDHRWWSIDELDATTEQVWPEDLAAILRRD